LIIVTGGAGFIGSNFIHMWLELGSEPVLNFDKLTYAANPCSLADLADDQQYEFVQGDICNAEQVKALFERCQPRAIVHFAAESHVDRSILGPEEFIRTNVNGTFVLLEAARTYWSGLNEQCRQAFRFLHVSTDEVYGSLSAGETPFCETTAYQPNSPYSASKAAADHLVRAYHHTYGLPTLTTNCSNNYGPRQFPEKLIPLVISNALEGKALPIYGDGMNVRDWLYVEDHCAAIMRVLQAGRIGEVYNIGGWNEMPNIEIVRNVCDLLDEMHPESPITPHRQLITFVKDRPGHDRRYAIDARKIERDLGWKPNETFSSGIRKTVRWYLDNTAWIANIKDGSYQRWINQQYGS